MSERPVLWTRTAQTDLEEIIAAIAETDPIGALRVLDRLQSRAAGLTELSDRGRIVPELRDVGVDRYRELVEAPGRFV